MVPEVSPVRVSADAGGANGFRVALICMPFASADRPSIQVGLLGAIAKAAGFETDIFQFNLDLAAELSPYLYERLCERRSFMTGEWLFALAAFGSSAPDDEAGYLDQFREDFTWADEIGKDVDFFLELRHETLPRFIDARLAAVDWARYRVVGFSSLFQQNVSSLALACRIKERWPETNIVFGGANMEGEMGAEYSRAFPFIDYVVSGEGDDVFPALLHQLAGMDGDATIPGVIKAGTVAVDDVQAPPVYDLNRFPVPDYGPYFEHATELGLLPHYKTTWTLPYESSRGCWWGQKHHCTFCGLNGEGMGYRSKSSDRVLAELSELAGKYRICSFMVVDNILDVRYIRELFGKIGQAKLDYSFFYEVKANLTREKIQTMYRGGVRRVQPGIESLSTHILNLMRKGCTMLQNVRCLKWLAYYGIGANWNLIWGFPGETTEDYDDELRVLRCISHLEPPVGSGRIWLERFSPHYTDPSFPVRNMRPEASYRYVYPDHVDLMKVAYFFDYEMDDVAPQAAHEATHSFVTEWRDRWRSGKPDVLTYRRTADGVLIDEKRGADREGTYSVTGANALIYEYCTETMRTPAQVADYLRTTAGSDYSDEEVRDAMDEFSRAQLMLSEDDKYLGLALPLNPNW